MIEIRYKEDALTTEEVAMICDVLEEALRASINNVRPEKKTYGITLEADPFGPIHRNQPDLRIYVLYHEEWRFTEVELESVLDEVKNYLILPIKQCSQRVCCKIRLYRRSGHASTSIST